MPRRARLRMAGVPLHIIQRGNNRSVCFFSDADRLCYLSTLESLARRFECAVHAYVLMSNHVHLLLTPAATDGASTLMGNLGQRYVQYVNRIYGRSGSLWEGRFRSSLVETDTYFLCCQRYIELNPVRAGMAERPEEYPWSSFRANGMGRADRLVTQHDEYRKLGSDPAARQAAYRELVVDAQLVHTIRTAANAGYALGSDRFQAELQAKLGRRTGKGVNGRPRDVLAQVQMDGVLALD